MSKFTPEFNRDLQVEARDGASFGYLVARQLEPGFPCGIGDDDRRSAAVTSSKLITPPPVARASSPPGCQGDRVHDKAYRAATQGDVESPGLVAGRSS